MAKKISQLDPVAQVDADDLLELVQGGVNKRASLNVPWRFESLLIEVIAGGVNYLLVHGNTTGSAPAVTVGGSDTNIGIQYQTKGTGTHFFRTDLGTATQFHIARTALAVNYVSVVGGAAGFSPWLYVAGADTNIGLALYTKGNGVFAFYTNFGAPGVPQFVVAHTASSVNYVQVTGGQTTSPAKISAQGTDTDISLTYSAKGIGGHVFYTSGGGAVQFSVGHVASSVNWVTAAGAATGNAVSLQSQGNDTNVDLALIPKGTGVVKFGTHSAIAAETLSGYITIKDAGGTSRKVAVVS